MLQADVAILEEPEHLTWFHHGRRYTEKFQHVIGIMHTNYIGALRAHPSHAEKCFSTPRIPECQLPSIVLLPCSSKGSEEACERCLVLQGCSSLQENGPTHRYKIQCCAWCADYVRRGGTGNAGGPLAARIVGIANRRMCDIHCHKVHCMLCPCPPLWSDLSGCPCLYLCIY